MARGAPAGLLPGVKFASAPVMQWVWPKAGAGATRFAQPGANRRMEKAALRNKQGIEREEQCLAPHGTCCVREGSVGGEVHGDRQREPRCFPPFPLPLLHVITP